MPISDPSNVIAMSPVPPPEAVVREHYDHVYRFCLGMTNSPELAQDAVQQSFLTLTKSAPSIQNWTKIRSWLFTTAKRHLFRQTSREHRRETLSLDDDSLPESTFAIADDVMEKADSHAAVAALQHLDEAYREVLMLYYLQDLSYEELAQQLEIPIGTVMSRLYRAKRKLAAILQDRPAT